MTRTPTETAALIAARYPRTDRESLARDIAAAIESAVQSEREACVAIAGDVADRYWHGDMIDALFAERIRKEIVVPMRARGTR